MHTTTTRNETKKQNYSYQPRHGQVQFRVLCNSCAIGGLIGPDGSIIKSICRDTSSRINVDVSGHACQHRIVHVIGDSSLSRDIHLDALHFHVSLAQDALLRVFDRMLESEEEYNAHVQVQGGGGHGGEKEKEKGGFVKCRLVVGPGMVGAVLGKGGQRVTKVIHQHRAYVKILPLHSPLPPGADALDEIVQITGGYLPVKKTLVVLSRFLQQKAIELEIGVPGPSSQFLERSMKMDARNSQVNNTANRGKAEVVLKLICPYKSAGYVIGVKGRKVKSIEEETGASIYFSEADIDCQQRVVTISAFENRESQYSFAQNAAVRVFNELVSSEEGNTVTARLLIQPNQSDWLTSGEVSVISTINNACGATLKIMELDNLLVGAAANDKVLQIDGDYPDVQIALFQATWILRECVFDSLVPKDILPLLPHKLFNLPSEGNKITDLTNKMHNCQVAKEANSSLQPTLPHSQFSAGSSLATKTGNSGDLSTANFGSIIGGCNKSAIVTNTRLEIAVRENVFSAVYGENGSNLHRLRQISGATVEVHDPCSGADGKLFISGTRDQTLIAESLLQAFLMST